MRARTASALGWSLFGVSAAMVIAAIAIGGHSDPGLELFGAFWVVAILAFGLVGTLIVSRRPENPIGWIFCGIGISFSVSTLAQAWSDYAVTSQPGALPFGPFMAWLATWAWNPGVLLLFTFLLLLFPDGRLPSRRWRIVGWLSVVALFVMIVPVAVTAWPIRGPLLTRIGEDAPAAAPDSFKLAFNVQIVGVLLTFILGLASSVSLVLRLRRARGDERAQLRWFAFAGTIVVLSLILASPLFRLPEAIQLVAFPLIPIASAVAIFKYRLYDIDIVIRKTVVFGSIAVFITLVYMALVVGPILLIGDRGDNTALVLSGIAAGVIAVAFQPIRQRAQRFANRLVYGRRASPYEVLSELSERIGDAFATEDVLPRMVRALAEGTGATRTEVWLRNARQMRLAASWPDTDGGPRSMPLIGEDVSALASDGMTSPVRHQGELLGALTVRKPPAEPPTPAEEKLVADLAAQAGLVLRNVALIADLRASRQRLVAAQDEERRKIERNLHDGAQQQLVALSVKQRLAEGLVDRDPQRARALLVEIRDETVEALETLRNLARGIYPPLLADQGLAAALESQARKAALPVQVESDLERRYGAEIEAAVYFCCLEALQNVAKYAGASSAMVRLTQEDDGLVFEVRDDGAGFDPDASPPGTGLQGMTDRIDALGGELKVASAPGEGTTVRGRIVATP